MGKPGEEFTVRVTVHPSAWDLHAGSAYKVKLFLDEREVRSRTMMRPQFGGEDVTWTFETLPSCHAMQFADRKGNNKAKGFGNADGDVGKLRVTFQAAEQQFRTEFEEMMFGAVDEAPRKKKKDEEREDPDWESAPQVKFNPNQKDKFGTLRTVKGRLVKKPRKRTGGFSGPRWNVHDYLYGEESIFYDTADHLEYRGILRPQFQEEHRYFFPDRDFSTVKSKGPSVVLDITGGGKPVARKMSTKKKQKGAKLEKSKANDGEWISVFDD